MVALRIGAGWLLVGAGGAFPDGDAVPDGDLLGSDEDVFDEQSQDVLALLDGRGRGGCPDLGEEAFHVDGELEVGLAVGELGVDRVELGAEVGLAGAQIWHPGAELVEGDQLLGERGDHRGDSGAGLGLRGLQVRALAGGGIGGAGVVQPLVDLGADQGRVGEQRGDVVPDDLVEVVGPDRFVGANPSACVAVVVAAQAPVVVDLLRGGAGRGAVVAVAAA
jgi:hypothetical protein